MVLVQLEGPPHQNSTKNERWLSISGQVGRLYYAEDRRAECMDPSALTCLLCPFSSEILIDCIRLEVSIRNNSKVNESIL